MLWFRLKWHTFWFNWHCQMWGDTWDSNERIIRKKRMTYHQNKIRDLLCE